MLNLRTQNSFLEKSSQLKTSINFCLSRIFISLFSPHLPFFRDELLSIRALIHSSGTVSFKILFLKYLSEINFSKSISFFASKIMLSQALTKQENSEQLENLLITFDNSKKYLSIIFCSSSLICRVLMVIRMFL